jgi:hypothetical protein
MLTSFPARFKRGCPHASAGLFRKTFKPRDGSTGYHLQLICRDCGAAVNPGQWVPRASVPNAGALPELPAAEGPRQLDLFGGEAGAR